MKSILYTIKQLLLIPFRTGKAWSALQTMEIIFKKHNFEGREYLMYKLLCIARLPAALIRYYKVKDEHNFSTYFTWYVLEEIRKN